MRIFLLSLLCVFTFSAWSNTGYKIEFELENYDSKELIVGFYYGEQTLVKDTLRNDKADGKFILTGEDTLNHGIYLMLTQPDVEFIQFIVDADQEFTLKTDATDLSNVSFNGSATNTEFYAYLDFVKENREKVTALRGQKETLDSLQKSSEDQVKAIEKINRSVIDKQSKIVDRNPKALLSMLITSNKKIDMPEFEGTEDEVQLKKFNYYKAHYFDYIHLDDPKTLRTPFLNERINYYLDKLTHNHPDSINKSIDTILAKSKPAVDTYKYYLSTFLNKYHGSKVVGYDAVYVHIALKYYANGEASWVDEENLNKILDKARRTKPLLIGKAAPDFNAKDKDGNTHTLSKIDADYKVLMFWKPECGHCKKAMPFVVEFQDKFLEKGVRVVTFCTDGRKYIKECWDGVEEKGMHNLLNLADEIGRSQAQAKFYATSTPYIYILDREGKILMKRIGGEQLEEVMDEIIKMNQREKEATNE